MVVHENFRSSCCTVGRLASTLGAPEGNNMGILKGLPSLEVYMVLEQKRRSNASKKHNDLWVGFSCACSLGSIPNGKVIFFFGKKHQLPQYFQPSLWKVCSPVSHTW